MVAEAEREGSESDQAENENESVENEPERGADAEREASESDHLRSAPPVLVDLGRTKWVKSSKIPHIPTPYVWSDDKDNQ